MSEIVPCSQPPGASEQLRGVKGRLLRLRRIGLIAALGASLCAGVAVASHAPHDVARAAAAHAPPSYTLTVDAVMTAPAPVGGVTGGPGNG